MKSALVLLLPVLLMIHPPGDFDAKAKESAGGETHRAQHLQNPASDFFRVPFVNNEECGSSREDGCRDTLNIRPGIPFLLNQCWNLIDGLLANQIRSFAANDSGDSMSATFLQPFFTDTIKTSSTI